MKTAKPIAKLQNFNGTTIKITSQDKTLLDEIVTCLKLAFECEPKSQKMYSEDLDAFFQYFAISRKGV